MRKPPKRASAVAQAIREHIAAQLRPGDQLPSEAEFTRSLGVSRVTVRDALSQLWVEGLITRRWGVGTFVRERPVAAGGAVANIYVDLGDVGSLPERIRHEGHTPELAHARVEQVPCPAENAADLGTEPGEQVWFIERCLCVDGRPGVLLRAYVPLRVNGVAVDATPLTALDADIPSLIQRTGTRVVRDEARLDAAVADDTIRRLLDLPEPSVAVLHAHQASYSDAGDIVVSTESYYRSDVFSIMLVRTASG
ncbi:hypothetical protein ADL22_00335 [Streptomyces sp. NRRL F-4489]|uniref:GntR family transcriptional regulator n=1 Tax=Streptomyces sp. NRRL F-4489 TaxID=1609095 RepID=UPI000747236B|nr:GntR family transcriptional regulator [Streptomyces sp. NRRL F-4489]KUL55381.1 hypothetical protein ADL22_00335 [Streptomyces sp. NRRL F-4489]